MGVVEGGHVAPPLATPLNLSYAIVANNFKVEKITPEKLPPATLFQSCRG